jgi:MoaA/NifB/PqqE/SkfB family radical SAM enzyme
MLKQLLIKTDRKCLWKFIFNLGVKGAMGLKKHKKRMKKGEFFPAFHFISVTDDCNLNCQGCWVTGKKTNARMEPEMLDSIINQSKAKGSYFFGILGGEPLLYKPLFEVLRKHKDCYFQLFTNGTLLTKEVAEELRKLSNVSPLISFEGDMEVADIRRGGDNVYEKTQSAIDHAVQSGLITGVAMSVCKSNLELAFSEEFVNSLIRKGVIYLWYYVYRPVGKDATPELALSLEEIEKLRAFLVEARTKYKIVIIDAYWDQNGKGLCPAASGLSHHINASGDIEPCPVIQFATHSVTDGPLEDSYRNSAFLADFKTEIPKLTNGCVVMDNPQWLTEMVDKHDARDSSGRENEYERLKASSKVPSHGSVKEIREKRWAYRFAKKHAFFGLGAYG